MKTPLLWTKKDEKSNLWVDSEAQDDGMQQQVYR